MKRCADTAALPYNAFMDHLSLPEVATEATAAEALRTVPGRKTLVKHKMSFHRARIRQVSKCLFSSLHAQTHCRKRRCASVWCTKNCSCTCLKAAEALRTALGRKTLVKHTKSFHRARTLQVSSACSCLCLHNLRAAEALREHEMSLLCALNCQV